MNSAAVFVMNLLRMRQANPLPESQLQNFKGSLEDLLKVHYKSHWYPDVPTKGSGYRCIRINGKMDPIIERAGVAVGLHPRTLRKMLPLELTMWIDPDEVSYRIGENGSICVIYDTQSRESPSDLDSTGSAGSEEYANDRMARLDNTEGRTLDKIMEYLDRASSTKSSLNTSISSNSSSSSSSTASGGQNSPPPMSPPFSYRSRTFNHSNHQQQHQQHQPQPQQQLHHHQQHQPAYHAGHQMGNMHQAQHHHPMHQHTMPHPQQQQHFNNHHMNGVHHMNTNGSYFDGFPFHWDGYNAGFNKVRTHC